MYVYSQLVFTMLGIEGAVVIRVVLSRDAESCSVRFGPNREPMVIREGAAERAEARRRQCEIEKYLRL